MGDNTRFTFHAARNYVGVVKQQGRVDLDADWNEQIEIVDRRWRAETIDIAGRCVVARETPDAFKIQASGATFTIHPGRLYVDGLLAESHGRAPLLELDAALDELRSGQPLPYDAQPYAPVPAPLPPGGPHLVYLEVWRQREVNHIQDPSLLEKALGGVDTTTRLQTVWQIKVLPNVGVRDCRAPIDAWDALVARPAGRLTTSAIAPPASDDPYIISPGGGYRGLENRLYRVEIHTPGPLGTAKFKWSRENGSVMSAVEAVSAGADELTVRRLGRDQVLRFHVGDWVEILDDHTELTGVGGHLGKVTHVNESARILTVDPPIAPGFAFDPSDPARHTRVRRWDQRQDVDANGLVDVTAGPIVLEDGIQVSFAADPATGSFNVAEYWAFAGRTADGSVELLEKSPPRGIYRHYCRLALIMVAVAGAGAGARVAIVADCRPQAADGPSPAPTPGAPGIQITAVNLSTGVALDNDRDVSVADLAGGVRVRCNDELDPATVQRKPTCVITLDLPYPLNDVDRQLWFGEGTDLFPVLGTQPLTLAGEVTAERTDILWKPAAQVGPWLENQLFQLLSKRNVGAAPLRVLAHLTMKGNFIWGLSNPENRRYLDGEVLGFRRAGAVTTDVRLPSGDGRPGGNFEMWFWLVPGGPVLNVGIAGQLVYGTVLDSARNVVRRASVTLIGPIGRMTTATDPRGRFSFSLVAPGTYRIEAQSGGLTAGREVDVTGDSRLGFDPRLFPGRTLEEVEGIGARSAARLREHNINHPAEVASMDPPRLGEILGLPAARAERIRDNARRLLV